MGECCTLGRYSPKYKDLRHKVFKQRSYHDLHKRKTL